MRRERNKMAAARCRKRRLDQTVTLQIETEKLEKIREEYKRDIERLQMQVGKPVQELVQVGMGEVQTTQVV